MVRRTGCLLLLFGLTGCAGPAPVANPEKLPLRHLAILYGQYRNSHMGKAPKDEAEFKKFLNSLDATQLAAAGLDKSEVDSMFISPRDKQPYAIRYGDAPPAPGPDGPSVVVFEKQGVAGKRYVAYTTGEIEEVDEAKFQKIRFTVK
jgi:hypothetical protein